MALNCPFRAPEGEPCGECDSCTRIWSGNTSLDVVEIDAASNRGVEDARNLRERAMYAPSEDGRYKVYIVDEAHMLTREAWNALLKILEEPPPRVIFVFATTEPQKIQQLAAPILSRCQSFAFRRIGQADILARLRTVLEREGIEAPEDALRLVARRADGGMRDALSLLDQVLALTGGEVDVDATRKVLGLVEEERYLELFGIVSERRAAEVFPFVERLLDEGYDLVEFHQGVVDTLRTLLRIRLDPSSASLLSEGTRPGLEAAARAFSPGDLVRMLSLASELESGGALRRTAHPRVLLELLFLRMVYLDRTVELEALIRALGGAPLPDGGEGPLPSGGGGAGGASQTRPSSRKTERTGEGASIHGGPGSAGFAGQETPPADPRPTAGAPAGPEARWFRVLPEEADPSAGRIGHDTVRRDRLREILAREPLLRQAVETFDLELLD